MKKIIWLVMLILCISFVSADLEDYSEGIDYGDGYFGYSGSNRHVWHVSFTASATYDVDYIVVPLKKLGSPTTNVGIQLYTQDGSKYPDTLVAQSANLTNGADIALAYTNYTFNFDGETLTNGGDYVLVFNTSNPGSTTSYYYAWASSSGSETFAFNTQDFANPSTVDTTAAGHFYIHSIIVIPVGTNSSVDLISPDTPHTNDTLEMSFYYNATWFEQNITNCSLYTNQTSWGIKQTQPAVNFTIQKFLQNFTNGTYFWNVGCDNGTFIRFGDANRTLNIDTVPPVLVTDFINNSFYFNRNLSGQFNFSDSTLLHSINISLPNDDLTIFQSDHIHLNFFSYNLSYGIESLGLGDHLLRARFADGHTAKKLKAPQSYNPKNGIFNDYMQYDFETPYNIGMVRIKQKDGSIFDNWETEEKFDRYIFKFKPNTKKSSYTFEVEAQNYLYIYEEPSSEYKQWLVYDDHWLDFMPYKDVEFNRISDTLVEVTVNGVDPNADEIIFNSVGDLNIVIADFTFKKINVTETFSTPILQSLEGESTLYLDIKDGTATLDLPILTWNHTNYTSTLLISNSSLKRYNVSISDYNNLTLYGLNSTNLEINISHNWWFTFTGESAIDFTDPLNQTITFPSVDNCTTFGIVGINLSTKRDDSEILINSNTVAYVELYTTDSSDLTRLNLTWGNRSNFGICINPPEAEYNLFAQLEYQNLNASFNKETYYFVNATLNNATQFVDLFLTPGGSTVEFTVRDENDDLVENVYIYILKYDFGTNTHKTNEIIKTDTSGTGLGTVVLNTDWYKFMLVINGITVLNTEPVKLTSTEKVFRINLATDQYAALETVRSVQTSLTYTNSTRNFAYTFVSTTGTPVTGCLNVIKRDISGDTLLNQSCVRSASSTILLGIGTDLKDNTFIAEGTIQVNPIINDIFEVSFATGYIKWGKDGIFITFLLRLTMAMVGIWSPPVAIVLMAITDAAMFSIGLMSMSWTFFITYLMLALVVIVRVGRK